MYENSDCVVIPSRFEGLPTVLLEAMHAGTPVVMADVNGLGRLVGECGSGLSVPSEDPESLALAMSRVMEADEDQASAWGTPGSPPRGITSGTGSQTEYWASTGGC